MPASLGNLSSLLDLRLTRNKLVGSIPESIGYLPTLSILNLNLNNLSGPVPTSLFNMSSLTALAMGNNSLTGRLPSHIGYTLPKIRILILASNKFDGPIPSSLVNAYHMQWLYLGGNRLTGRVPFFGSLPNLEELDVTYNMLDAGDWGFVSSLSNCSRLTKLYQAGNDFRGQLPSSIGNLSGSLAVLWLRDNKISGPIPPEMGNLKNLNTLCMDYNRFTGSIPPTIGNLKNLVVLAIAQNRLSGTIPDAIGNLVQLTDLKLDANNLSGRIPASIGCCTQLQILNLAHNALNGSIPRSIFKISSLSLEFDLSHNYLDGGIPKEIGNLINLNKLSISNNKLSGNIPSTLGQCVLLEYLKMQNNFFAGSIPQSFAELVGIKELDISRNDLSGKIPELFTSLNYLHYLNLSFNNFDGAVPIGGIFGNASAVSIEGNDQLCSSVLTGGIHLCSARGDDRKSKNKFLVLVAKIVIPIVTIILFYLATFFWRKRMQAQAHLQQFNKHMKNITYDDIIKATDMFSSTNLIGSGSFGKVYKGRMKLHRDQVAIKIFNLNIYGSHRSFLAECEAVKNARHRNIVKIITLCSSVDPTGADFKAIVYPYMLNGNLDIWLNQKPHQHSQRKILTLSQRINIALDLAYAMDYLHNQCAPSLIHCDLKPSNILLDHDMVAYVSDFGLARFQSICDESENDRQALLRFKSQLSGSAKVFTPWSNASSGFCSWHGVTCSARSPRRVIALDLTSEGITGIISPCIANLSSLTRLQLSNNSFHGSIPSELGLLSQLSNLNLSMNSLEGNIPSELSSCLSLIHISTEPTQHPEPWLTGSMPYFGSLPNLEQLDVSYNILEAGDWGFVSSLSNCSKLTQLMLDGNNLQGNLPSSIGNLSRNLELLWLRNNRISGPIPPEIGNLKSLNELYMDYNLFTGNIPPTIGNLHNLVVLALAQNRLSGPIPDIIGNLIQLTDLKLDGNNLSGKIPASIGSCSQLQILNLAHNSLNGSMPSKIFKILSLSQEFDLSHNYLSGGIPEEVGNLINLNKISISNNRLAGNIPPALGLCVSLEYLEMQYNFFVGSIPQSFVNLRSIKEMDISKNNLSGKIPDFLASLSSLDHLNLSFNNFSGAVPSGGVFGNASMVSVEGNKYLCPGVPTGGVPLCSAMDNRGRKHKSLVQVIEIVIPIIAVFIITWFCLMMFFWGKKMQEKPHFQQHNEQMTNTTYKDIVQGTNNFSSANLIGSGSFGTVYKGNLKLHKNQVAIKIFDLNINGAQRSFLAECEALRNARHRNILKIITLCLSVDPTGADFKAIVFPYTLNGNLDMWLHQKDPQHNQRKILTLSQRISIALDVAVALDYLHKQCAPSLVHCDIKPSNVLLDLDMVAYVSDFGLARFQCTRSSARQDGSASLVGLKGTIGYIPPEYGMSEDISTKGDVYSFGVLLLEMMTGCRPTDEKFSNGTSLHEFVNRAFPENVAEVVDPTMLQDDINTAELLQNCIIPLGRIGLSCSMTSPKERPGMDKVSTEILTIKNMFSSILDQSKEERDI
ncbi:putative LRR receptor-like serine/threonine-protein kinase [Dichanthelium oligosanthes]|uniref:Receptor kinase-like protein Xa21 n=1 Tax=Dichanthelium oligosanthes TaxID=888268 RepID=A0A1E5UU65_9POAL|nr:putative LRR receptor-like serine/threonine-protein kinase [Dichanthelium oligosanthes]